MKLKERDCLRTEQLGFTLLEVLFAICIFAIVVGLIYSSYTGVLTAINISMPRGDAYRRADIAMTRILEDLESVYFREELPIGQPTGRTSRFVGENLEVDGRAADRLEFVSNAHVRFSDDEPELGQAVITYSVQQGENGSGFVLYRADRALFAGTTATESTGQVLCDQLASVDFTYFDQDGQAFETWDAGDREESARIPRMVSVRLEVQDEASPQGLHLFFSSIILPTGPAL